MCGIRKKKGKNALAGHLAMSYSKYDEECLRQDVRPSSRLTQDLVVCKTEWAMSCPQTIVGDADSWGRPVNAMPTLLDKVVPAPMAKER